VHARVQSATKRYMLACWQSIAGESVANHCTSGAGYGRDVVTNLGNSLNAFRLLKAGRGKRLQGVNDLAACFKGQATKR
jgi:hypothetical protein